MSGMIAAEPAKFNIDRCFWNLRLLFVIAASLSFIYPSAAVQPDEILSNPQLEQRARALSGKLRCLVCRNESIDDSNAALARDLRLLVRERLQAGETDAQILNFMVTRYGDYILLQPPFSGKTLILWLFPLFILAAAAVYLYRAVYIARQREQEQQVLTCEEEAELRNFLGDTEGERHI